MSPTLKSSLLACLSAVMFMAAAHAADLVVPQSLRLEYDTVLDELTRLSGQGGPIGSAAAKALPVVKAHFAKEAEFVFPPLSILSDLAKGQLRPEMKDAIAMADRARAMEAELWNEHVQITSLMNELIVAGKAGNQEELVTFATRVATHSLNEMEVLLPATMVIGDYLRSRLPPGQ